jgi:hypothetical protein
MQTPHKQPRQRLMHLPTPPPSFGPDLSADSSPMERSDILWGSTPTATGARSHDELRSSPTPVRPLPQDVARRLRLSMSPEPDFPRLPPPGSNRATPDRDMGPGTRESSPGMGRTPSPERFDADRSRSNSPEETMRPPPLSPLTETNLKTQNHRRTPSAGARSVMSAYDMITSYIGHESPHPTNQRRTTPAQNAGFQPNAGLSKPITPSFIRDYNSSGSVPPPLRQMSAMDDQEDGSSSRIFGGSLLLSNTYGSDGTATSQSGDILRMSELSRQRQQMGWNYGRQLEFNCLLPQNCPLLVSPSLLLPFLD